MSQKWTLNKADLISLGKSVLLATAGYLVAYLLQVVIPNLDLGSYSWVIPVVTVLLNALKKWVSGPVQLQ